MDLFLILNLIDHYFCFRFQFRRRKTTDYLLHFHPFRPLSIDAQPFPPLFHFHRFHHLHHFPPLSTIAQPSLLLFLRFH